MAVKKRGLFFSPPAEEGRKGRNKVELYTNLFHKSAAFKAE